MSETKPEHGITGVKYDAHKPMMDLIPPLMELEVARVLTADATLPQRSATSMRCSKTLCVTMKLACTTQRTLFAA